MRTRLWIRFAIVAILFIAALPFLLLSGLGWMKPAGGFCLEHGLSASGNPPTAEETAASFFLMPELAPHAREFVPGFSWSTCLRSRRGEHRAFAFAADRNLARLGEPNTSHLHETDPAASYLRIVTVPSFSRVAIAIALSRNTDGAGHIRAVWLHDAGNKREWEGGDTWHYAALPTSATERAVSPAGLEEIWALADKALPRQYRNRLTIDGTWAVTERIEAGGRVARAGILDGAALRLFCRMAVEARISPEALDEGAINCGMPAG